MTEKIGTISVHEYKTIEQIIEITMDTLKQKLMEEKRMPVILFHVPAELESTGVFIEPEKIGSCKSPQVFEDCADAFMMAVLSGSVFER